jgi:hypothetical protein
VQESGCRALYNDFKQTETLFCVAEVNDQSRLFFLAEQYDSKSFDATNAKQAWCEKPLTITSI